MNILIVADRIELAGGLESHVISQINSFLSLGHNVILHTNALSEFHYNSVVYSPNVVFAYIPWSADPIADLHGYSFDVVHAHPFTAIFRGKEIAEYYSKPYFITMHGYYTFGVDRSEIGNSCSKLAKKIITVDDGVYDLLKYSISYPEKLMTLYNAVDLEVYKPMDKDIPLFMELSLYPNFKTLVSICRFDDGKQEPIIQLMDILPRLSYSVKGLNVILVGDGSFAEKVYNTNREAIDNSGVHLNVVRVGRRDDVARFLSIADLVMACGRASLEAMSCKRAVYLTSMFGFGGILTGIDLRKNAFKADGYSWIGKDKLVDDLTCLLCGDSLRNSIANTGYEIAMNCCDLSKNTNTLLNLYQNC